MIHKIALENFFSIADRQELCFAVADSAPDLPCLPSSWGDPKRRLPITLGFFGPNASGKSTVLNALVAAADFAQTSFNLGVDSIIPEFMPYMRKDWWGRPSSILIEFDARLADGKEASLFRYELQIDHEYKMGKTVRYEALSYAPKGKFRKLFERQQQKFSFGKEFEIIENDPRLQAIRPNASLISTLAQLNHAISIYLTNSLNELRTNINRTQPSTNQLLSIYNENEDYLGHLNKELGRLDVGIESMLIEQSDRGLLAKFKHTGLDDDIFMESESDGTKRFIEIFPRLYSVLKTGSIAIIDEIDSHIHPLLLPELFRWFSDSKRNPHKAQLFFSAHNPTLLDELEKEQIFFTVKPSGQATQIYGARDIKGLRREPSLMKKYLAGELGAVPHIG